MSIRLVEYKLNGGGTVFVEVESYTDAGNRFGRGETIEARQTFEQALCCLKPVTDAVIASVTALPSDPHEVEVEFGLSITADFGPGVILAKTAGEGSLKLKIKWKKSY